MSHVVWLAVATIFVATLTVVQSSYPTEDALFEEHVKKHGKKYENDEHRKSARRNFGKFAAYIQAHPMRQQKDGTKKLSFEVEFNELSVMTEEELKLHKGVRVPTTASIKLSENSSARHNGNSRVKRQTEIFDWTYLFGAVRNQTGVYEAFVKKMKTVTVDLAEQMLVDCDKTTNAGCNGGWPLDAWNYYTSQNRPMSEASYPYTRVQGICKYKSTNTLSYLTTYGSQLTATEADLLAALKLGPVVVALYASLTSFSAYKSGVYFDPDCPAYNVDTVDHAVILVGSGVDSATGFKYWKIRNSWGPYWGESGYMRIYRGTDHCGIEDWGQQVFLA